MLTDLERAEKALEEYLTATNGRLTEERRCLLARAYQYEEPFTAQQLLEDTLDTGFRISRATVYNVLELYQKAGVVLQLQMGSVGYRYVAAMDHRGVQYLICTRCGRLQRLTNRDAYHAIYRKRIANFQMTHFALCVYGTCKKCKKTKI